MNNEYILCSAIWFDNGIEYAHQPINIDTGIVLCGWRHSSIFPQIGGLVKDRKEIGLHEREQGFLTSKNRFVDRNEAAMIARDANQIKWSLTDWDTVELFSEDLW